MKTKFLFPHKYKIIGWIVLGISIVFLIIHGFEALSFLDGVNVPAVYDSGFFLDSDPDGRKFFTMVSDDFQLELIGTLFIVGALLVSFSRLKEEDEYISKIRLESLVWATFVHFIGVIVFTLGLYGSAYLDVMLINMVSILVFFILKFHITILLANRRYLKSTKKVQS